MPVTRTSLPGVAVVAGEQMSAGVPPGAPRPTPCADGGPPRGCEDRRHREHCEKRESGMNRHEEAMVTPSRRIHPQVVTTDVCREHEHLIAGTAGRSGTGALRCAMVATDAWSRATCPSSAIVTLSRKRRWTRVLTVRRNHVAAADTPSATAAIRTSPRSPCRTPSPSSLNQRARSASGRALISERRNEARSNPGS